MSAEDVAGRKDGADAARESGVDRGRAEARRLLFLKAATDVFQERGYESASMAEIVKRAGGSLSTLYSQFRDKDGLLDAVIDMRINETARQLDEEIHEPMPLEAGLRRLGARMLVRLSSPESLGMVRLMAERARRSPERSTSYAAQIPDRITAAITRFLESRVEAGEVEIEDVKAAAALFLDLLRGGMYLRAIMRPDYTPSEEEVSGNLDRAVKVFMGGVKAL